MKRARSPLDGSDSVAPWPIENDHAIAETRIFTLRQMRTRSPRGSDSADFVYIDSTDWVNVIALTPDDQVVLIEQYRHGTREVTLEIPGGMVDAGEDPAEACRRELLEETGYAGDAVELIGAVSPNPAIQNNRCFTGLVRGAARVAEPDLDAFEDIVVRSAPLDEVGDLIRRDAIHHALVVAAFYHLELWRQKRR